MTTQDLAVNGGPRTEAGKAASSRNSLRHAILSPKPVVEGLERLEDWETYRKGIVESLAPVGVLEVDLAEHAACLLWRRKRVTRYEAESIMLAREDVERKRLKGEVHENTKNAVALLEALPDMPGDKTLDGEEIVPIFAGLADRAGPAFYKALYSFSPKEDAFGYRPTAEEVRGVIAAVAEHEGASTRLLILELKEAARKKAEYLETEVMVLEMGGFFESLIDDVAFRERSLPDEKTLEKIRRYEAHLTRQLNQTLHELEALQTRRQGGSAPLARLDVQGLHES